MRKIALLTGVAGILFAGAPALAQETTRPLAQDPIQQPAPAPSQDPAAPQPSSQQSDGGVTLQPGAVVRGEDGVQLGALEGVQVNDQGRQELTVRGADGLIRAVGLTGFRMENGEIHLAASLDDYLAGDVLSDPSLGEGDAATPPTLPEEPTEEPIPDGQAPTPVPDQPQS